MGQIRIGAKSRVGLAQEASVNTAMTTQVLHVIPIAGGSTIGWTEEGYQPDEIQPNPNPTRTEEGLHRVEGSIVQAVENESFGMMCYWFFGDYAVSGPGPFEHVFKIDGSIPPTVQVEVGETTQARFDLLDGVVITGMELQAAKESAMCTCTWTLSGIGKYTANETSSIDASPTTYAEPRHSKRNLTVKIDTVASSLVTSMSISIQRPATRIEAMDGNPFAADIHQGKYDITLEMEGYWDQSDTIRGLADAADHSVELISPSPNPAAEEISIFFPEVRFYHVSAPGIPDDMPQRVSVQGKPYYLDASEASSVVVTIDNDIVDYSVAGVIGTP